jgi:hypothetical protein
MRDHGSIPVPTWIFSLVEETRWDITYDYIRGLRVHSNPKFFFLSYKAGTRPLPRHLLSLGEKIPDPWKSILAFQKCGRLTDASQILSLSLVEAGSFPDPELSWQARLDETTALTFPTVCWPNKSFKSLKTEIDNVNQSANSVLVWYISEDELDLKVIQPSQTTITVVDSLYFTFCNAFHQDCGSWHVHCRC